MAATPTELAAASECIDRCIPDGQKWAVIIYLLARIANVSADPTTLAANAVCIDRCIPSGLKPAVIINLLNSLSASAATPLVLCGAGDPVTDPGVACAVYTNTNNDSFWLWRLGAWTLKA